MNTIQTPEEILIDELRNEIAELKAVGRLMRKCQREYFDTRSTGALKQAKHFERAFDAMCKPVERDPQAKLF